MQVNLDKVRKVTNYIAEEVRVIKTRPYPTDSVTFTQYASKKKSFWGKLFGFIKNKQEINPQTFKSSYGWPHKPYYASRESVAQSNKYLKNNYIGTSEKILNGYRDAGREIQFTRFGDAICAEREVIVIDRKYDKYLNNVIEYVSEHTKNMSEKRKIEYIAKFIERLGGNTAKAIERSGKLTPGKEILLGRIFEAEAACCRHKSLLFKILAQETGIKASIRRGMQLDLLGYGGHCWNEVKLINGKRIIVDTQNSLIMKVNAPKAKMYLDVDMCGIY